MKKIVRNLVFIALAACVLLTFSGCDWLFPPNNPNYNTNNCVAIGSGYYNGSGVLLQWATSGTYYVYRSTARTGTFSYLGVSSTILPGSPARPPAAFPSYLDTTVSPTTVYYYVATQSSKSSVTISDGDGGAYVWSVYTAGGSTPPPLSSYNFASMVYGFFNASTIRVDWLSTDTVTYYIYASTTKTGTYNQVGSYTAYSSETNYDISSISVPMDSWNYFIVLSDNYSSITINETDYATYGVAVYNPAM